MYGTIKDADFSSRGRGNKKIRKQAFLKPVADCFGRGEMRHGEYAFSDGEEVRLNKLAIDPQSHEKAWFTEDFMMIVSAAGKKWVKEMLQ